MDLPVKQDVFGYLRMALVTGLMEKSDVVAWADRALLNSSNPDGDYVELSLAGNQSYARMVGLLSQLQGEARYDLPLKLLFAHAGRLLEADPARVGEIIEGIRLLRAEEYLPSPIRQKLDALDRDLGLARQNQIPAETLYSRLADFLEPYAPYRGLLIAPG